MMQALLYDATKMLNRGVPPKTVYDFLNYKLDKDFQGGTWWTVNWEGSSRYAVKTLVKMKKCPICLCATVNESGHCLSCDADCSVEDLNAFEKVEEKEI